jgi:hypothetical protein
MPRYCRAYHVRELRRFAGWREGEPPLEGAPEPARLDDDDIVFLHDDLAVTRGTIRTKDVLFHPPEEPDAWEAFCHGTLGFAAELPSTRRPRP